eukprot:2334528-Rhodomonas_salina.1
MSPSPQGTASELSWASGLRSTALLQRGGALHSEIQWGERTAFLAPTPALLASLPPLSPSLPPSLPPSFLFLSLPFRSLAKRHRARKEKHFYQH